MTTKQKEHPIIVWNNYLEEVPATFNDLARRFAVPGLRADGVLESHAGKLTADVLSHLAQLVDSDQLTPGQVWSAIAAERGSVGACNMMANLCRAAQGQVIANKTMPDKAAAPDAFCWRAGENMKRA